MHQHTSTPAVRRFYTLFYQWSQLQRHNHQLVRSFTTTRKAQQQTISSTTVNPSEESHGGHERRTNHSNTHRKSQDGSTVPKTARPTGSAPPHVPASSSFQYLYGSEFWLPFRVYRSQVFQKILLEIEKRPDVGKLIYKYKYGSHKMLYDDPNRVVKVSVSGTYLGVQAVKELLDSQLLPSLPRELNLPLRRLDVEVLDHGHERWSYAPVEDEHASVASSAEINALSLPKDITLLGKLISETSKGDKGTKASAKSHPTAPSPGATHIHGQTDSGSRTDKPWAPIVSDHVRSVCRSLTYPVVVITTRDAQPQWSVPAETLCRGVTVSSFSTVAMNPNPFVTFNLRSDSRTLQAIKATKNVVIHVLAATPSGARLASVFTKPRADPAEPFMSGEVGHVELKNDAPPKLSGVWADRLHTKGDHIGAAAGQGSAVIARMECKVNPGMLMKVGDHTACFGMITHVEALNEKGEAVEVDTEKYITALSYGERDYRMMGESVEKDDAWESVPNDEVTSQESEEQLDNRLEDSSLESAVEEYFSEISKPSSNAVDDATAHGSTTHLSSGIEVISSENGQNAAQSNENLQSPSMARSTALPRQTPGGRLDPSSHSTERQQAPHAWGLAQPMQTRTYSTLATIGHRTSSFSFNPQRRDYSTTGAIGGPQHPPIASPAQIKQKISSFFPQLTFGPNTPDLKKAAQAKLPPFASYHPKDKPTRASDEYLLRAGARSRRMRRLRTLQTTIDTATLQLDGELDLEDADRIRLETTIHVAQREMTRIIALRAADELASLLDYGNAGLGDFDANNAEAALDGTPRHSDWVLERYRVLEEQIEKGLAVLMEEAKELRDDLDGGRVKREVFEETKARLARDHELLDTQSLRLRSLMEEEQDWDDDS